MAQRQPVAVVVVLVTLLIGACSAGPPASPGPTGASPGVSASPGSTVGTAAPGLTDAPGATVTPDVAHDFDTAYGPAEPVNVTVGLSPLTFTSVVSVENGGFLSLVGADGTFYQLQLPANAVISDTEVTMTVVSSVAGSPLGDTLAAAVKLEPEGLRLMAPAALTIRPATPLATSEEGPFSADGDGAGFHLYPLDADPAAVVMHLTHFSIFGLFQTDAERRAEMIRKTAADVEAQLEQEIAAEIEKARNGDGTIDMVATEQKLNYYRDRVVRPMMSFAENDHTLFREAVQRWLSWERQRQLLGLGEENKTFDDEIFESFLRAFDNYVEHTIERCYEHDYGSMTDLLSLARMASLMGFEERLSQGQAFDQITKCATFTLEMDSTMEAHLNTCLLIDAGSSDVDETTHVTTSVELSGLQVGPASGPMQWQDASYSADCQVPGQGGGDIIRCDMSFAGFGDADEFAVLGLLADYNILEREPGQEETQAEFKLNGVIVQPGDPQILHDGSCTLLEAFGGDNETSRSSSGWLAGWKDNSAPVGREFINDEEFGEAYVLTGWQPSSDIEIIGTRDYEGGTNSIFGTTSEKTTFILRHTPKR